MIDMRGRGSRPKLVRLKRAQDQAAGVVALAKGLLANCVPASQIAILGRTRAHAIEVERALLAVGIVTSPSYRKMRGGLIFLALRLLRQKSMAQAIAVEVPKPAATQRPSGEAILRQMSSTLAGARQLGFKGTRQLGISGANRPKLQARSEFELVVRRPDKLVVVSTRKDGKRRMVFDGAAFTLYDGRNNMYADVAMPVSLDALPAELATVSGFLPPMVDFVMSDPYADLRRRTSKISLLGKELAGTPAVESHWLALSRRLADAQLWVGIDDHLPRKMTAIVRSGPDASSSVTLDFLTWPMCQARLTAAASGET